MIKRTYRADAEGPAIPLRWFNGTGTLIDMSAATFKLNLYSDEGTFTEKTTNITGYNANITNPNDPNVLITWATGELNISPGIYEMTLKATIAGRDSYFPESVIIEILAVAA